MRTYYVAGLPYSDELYHHGIKGQKWGLRRFQNEDRTWTAAGKIRYGAGKAAEATAKALKKTGAAVGRAAKATGSHIIKGIKRHHTWMMSDDELRSEINRINAEKTFKAAMSEVKSKRLRARFGKTLGTIAEKGATKFIENLATEAGKNLAKNIGTDRDKIKADKLRANTEKLDAYKKNVKARKEYKALAKSLEEERKAEAKEKRDAAVNKAKDVSRKMKNGADYMRSNWSSTLYDDIPNAGYHGRETSFVQSIWSEPLDDAMKARTYL